MNNEKMKQITLELPEKLVGLEKKHGIKRTGVWTVIPEHLVIQVYEVAAIPPQATSTPVIPEHLVIQVYEAPSTEALQKFSMEPAIAKWMAWNTSEIKLAISLEESMKLLK